MRKIALIIVLFPLFSVLNAQQNDSLYIKRISDEILTHGKAWEDLRELTKQVGPRLAGSAGMVKAEAWGLRKMQSIGAGKVFLQECLVPHWVRGGTDKLLAVSPKKTLDAVALGNSQGTGINGLTTNVVLVDSFAQLGTLGDRLKGKIVFYNYHFKQEFVRTFEAYGDAVKYRGGGPSAAAKYGAAGVIVRSMTHSTDNVPHTGSTNYDTSYKKIPAMAIGLLDADWLSEQLKKGAVTVTMQTNGHYLPDTIGHNVIAEWKGSEFPEEIITIGGHLDSWDLGEGAHDDGAGCVQTIEIFRTMKALNYQPRRTIRFVLFANEENGLRGGKKYAEQALLNKEKHIFALESDDGGFTPRGFGITATDSVFNKIKDWKELMSPYGSSEFTRGGGGADIGPLNQAFSTTLAGLEPDSQRYFDLHHTRADVFENVNRRELLLGAVNMAILVYLVDQHGL